MPLYAIYYCMQEILLILYFFLNWTLSSVLNYQIFLSLWTKASDNSLFLCIDRDSGLINFLDLYKKKKNALELTATHVMTLYYRKEAHPLGRHNFPLEHMVR